MESQPQQPQTLRPSDPHLPSVRSNAPCDMAERHRTAGPVPTQQVEPDNRGIV